MSDCIFCKIIAGEIPSNKIYEDELIYIFTDIAPVAPIHYIAIPQAHISGASEINSENSHLVAHIFEVIAQLADKLSLEGGFRVITNCGADAGQTVPHLHFHLLAGRTFSWPEG